MYNYSVAQSVNHRCQSAATQYSVCNIIYHQTLASDAQNE